MTSISMEFLTGVQLGAEYIDCRDDGYDITWMIAINLLIVRFVITKYDDEE